MARGLDLGNLFGAALKAMTTKRQDINALDGYNGNHGDNMVDNLQMITQALQASKSKPPAQGLEYASQQLQQNGHGGTSQYYAQGLHQAASQFQGKQKLDNNDVLSLVETLMSSIPSEGHPQQPQAGSSVLDVLGMLGGQAAQPQPQPQPQNNGFGLDDVLGLLGGGMAQAQAQPQQQSQPQDDGFGLDDVVDALLPAGMAFLQAKQAGADTKDAAGHALMSALMGGRTNPLQANTPRTAAGGLIAQSLLQALTGGK